MTTRAFRSDDDGWNAPFATPRASAVAGDIEATPEEAASFEMQFGRDPATSGRSMQELLSKFEDAESVGKLVSKLKDLEGERYALQRENKTLHDLHNEIELHIVDVNAAILNLEAHILDDLDGATPKTEEHLSELRAMLHEFRLEQERELADMRPPTAAENIDLRAHVAYIEKVWAKHKRLRSDDQQFTHEITEVSMHLRDVLHEALLRERSNDMLQRAINDDRKLYSRVTTKMRGLARERDEARRTAASARMEAQTLRTEIERNREAVERAAVVERDAIDRVATAVRALEDERNLCAARKAERDEARGQVRVFKATVSELHTQLGVLADRVKANEADHKTLVRNHKALTASHDRLATEHGRLGDDHTTLEAHHDAVVAERVALSAARDSIQADYDDLKRRYAALEAEHAALGSDHLSLGRARERLKEQHEALVGDHAELGGDHSDLDARFVALSDKHADLASTHVELTAVHADLTAAHASAEEQLTERKAQVKDLEAQLLAAQAELAFTKEEVVDREATIETREATIGHVQAAAAALEAQVVAANAEVALRDTLLVDRAEQIADLLLAVARLETAVDTKAAVVDTKEAHLASASETLEGHLTEIRNQRAHISELEDELGRVSGRLVASEAARETAEANLAAKTDEAEALRTENGALQEKLASAVEAAAREQATLRSEVEEEHTGRKAVAARLADTEAERDNLARELARLRADRDAVLESKIETEEENSTVHGRLKTERGEHEQTRATLNAVTREKAGLMSVNVDLEATVQQLREEVAAERAAAELAAVERNELEVERGALSATLGTVRHDLQEANALAETMRASHAKSLEVKEDTISSLTRRLEEAERMGEVQRKRADKLETEAAKVRSDLVAKSRDLRSFRTVVKAERVKSLGRERRNSVVKGGASSLAAIQREFSQRRSLDVSFNTKDDLTKVDHLEDLHTRLGVMIAHRRRDYAREVERLTRQLQQAQEDDDSRPTPETTEIVKRIQEELDRLSAEKDEEVAEMKATRDEIAGYIDDALAAEEHMELSVEEVTEEDVRVLVTHLTDKVKFLRRTITEEMRASEESSRVLTSVQDMLHKQLTRSLARAQESEIVTAQLEEEVNWFREAERLSEIDDLRTKLDRLHAMAEDNPSPEVAAKVSAAEEKLATAVREFEEDKAIAEAMEAQFMNLKEQVQSTAQREREERRAEEIHKTLVLHELETLRETNGELEADVAALRAQLAEATARLDEASASVTELNSSTEQFRSDQARMGAINEELKEALTAVTGVSDKQTARIAELEALLHSAHAELDALNASVVVVGDDAADGAAADGE